MWQLKKYYVMKLEFNTQDKKLEDFSSREEFFCNKIQYENNTLHQKGKSALLLGSIPQAEKIHLENPLSGGELPFPLTDSHKHTQIQTLQMLK